MKIVHLVESLDVGGLERVVVSLAAAQRRKGHDVAIACLFHEGPLAGEARALGIEVWVCDKRDGLDGRAVRRLRRVLRERRAEVLHTHNPIPHYYGVAAAFGLGFGCIVNTRHGMGSFPYSRKRELLYRLAMAGSHYGVSVCRAAQENFVRRKIIPRGKAITIVNGIDLGRFVPRNRDARRRLLAGIGCASEPVLFGTVGRLNAAKDHANLLVAMKQVCAAVPDVRLIIAGEGECRAALEAQRARLQLESSVHFVGNRDDVPELLAGLDAFVLSSRTEGYSLALVEAAAAALPAIATDVGGNGEIVRDGVTGLLVPPEDAPALARAMFRLIEATERRAAMGQAARRWALEAGSLESMARSYESLYRRGRLEFGESHRPSPSPHESARRAQ